VSVIVFNAKKAQQIVEDKNTNDGIANHSTQD
jgi:hypothetical protein